MTKLLFTLSIGYVGAKREEEFELDLEGLEGQEREQAIEEAWNEWAWNYIDGGWTEV
ncbi:hypothetical protein J2Z32_003492 [Paenibacillus turicensis]|uniref:DUF7167 domain-containing protein n=1 Tax=Paenibacillus turicensis TaxID=160487 RepID=A0ABS4FW68_9BACL|nr:hypothetical protein [Paenibacillus turicensis]MBP1906828.1 hypothetical protein [Paenibacillus turicensis]